MFGKNKSTGSIEYIVVGLGNPDRKYENTRHNAGWLAIDRIADKLGCDVNKIIMVFVRLTFLRRIQIF